MLLVLVLMLVRVKVKQMWVVVDINITVIVIIIVIVTANICCSRCRFLGTRRDFLVFPTSATNRDVTKRATFGPIPAARLAEVTWLSERVVVVVAKLGVCRVTPGAFESLIMLRPEPAFDQRSGACKHWIG